MSTVVNQHQIRGVDYVRPPHEYAGWKAFLCKGCGREKKTRWDFEKTPCDEPTLWVRIGHPGDGLRVCRDCGAVYIGDYSRGPFYERTCIECGSIEVYRDDDPDVEPSLVQPSYDGTHRPLHTGNDRTEEGEQ